MKGVRLINVFAFYPVYLFFIGADIIQYWYTRDLVYPLRVHWKLWSRWIVNDFSWHILLTRSEISPRHLLFDKRFLMCYFANCHGGPLVNILCQSKLNYSLLNNFHLTAFINLVTFKTYTSKNYDTNHISLTCS